METETELLQAEDKANENGVQITCVKPMQDTYSLNRGAGEHRLNPYFLWEKLPDQAIFLNLTTTERSIRGRQPPEQGPWTYCCAQCAKAFQNFTPARCTLIVALRGELL